MPAKSKRAAQSGKKSVMNSGRNSRRSVLNRWSWSSTGELRRVARDRADTARPQPVHPRSITSPTGGGAATAPSTSRRGCRRRRRASHHLAVRPAGARRERRAAARGRRGCRRWSFASANAADLPPGPARGTITTASAIASTSRVPSGTVTESTFAMLRRRLLGLAAQRQVERQPRAEVGQHVVRPAELHRRRGTPPAPCRPGRAPRYATASGRSIHASTPSRSRQSASHAAACARLPGRHQRRPGPRPRRRVGPQHLAVLRHRALHRLAGVGQRPDVRQHHLAAGDRVRREQLRQPVRHRLRRPGRDRPLGPQPGHLRRRRPARTPGPSARPSAARPSPRRRTPATASRRMPRSASGSCGQRAEPRRGRVEVALPARHLNRPQPHQRAVGVLGDGGQRARRAGDVAGRELLGDEVQARPPRTSGRARTPSGSRPAPRGGRRRSAAPRRGRRRPAGSSARACTNCSAASRHSRCRPAASYHAASCRQPSTKFGFSATSCRISAMALARSPRRSSIQAARPRSSTGSGSPVRPACTRPAPRRTGRRARVARPCSRARA